MTSANPTPVVIDYTSRDYYALRDDLIARVRDRVSGWTGEDPADFGLALIESFAYMGDMLSYYLDRVANETNILTATQRKNIINIAKSLGYTPSGYQAALAGITFTNSSTTALSIPAGTVISGTIAVGDTQQTIYFETLQAGTVPGSAAGVPGAVTLTAREGESVSRTEGDPNGELIGVSLGTPEQVFDLSQTPVVTSTIKVYVEDNEGLFAEWQKVVHIMDYGPLDAVYTVEDDGDGNISIKFGDGVSGAIPPIHAEIKCNYVVGGGTIGNVPTATLRKLEYVNGLTAEQVSALQATLQITNPSPASGGTDPESSASIRALAPQALRSLNRAVTLEDFANLATSVPGIGKAQARATTPQSVTVYIAPSRNDFDTDPTPGVNEIGDPTFEWQSLKTLADAEFATKALIGTTTTVLPPEYTPVVVTIEATALPTFGNAEVEKNIKLTLLNAFGYNYVSFKDTLTREGIEYVLQQAIGVKVARVTGLTRFGSADQNEDLNPLVGDYDEIFRFYESNLTISVTGGAY